MTFSGEVMAKKKSMQSPRSEQLNTWAKWKWYLGFAVSLAAIGVLTGGGAMIGALAVAGGILAARYAYIASVRYQENRQHILSRPASPSAAKNTPSVESSSQLKRGSQNLQDFQKIQQGRIIPQGRIVGVADVPKTKPGNSSQNPQTEPQRPQSDVRKGRGGNSSSPARLPDSRSEHGAGGAYEKAAAEIREMNRQREADPFTGLHDSEIPKTGGTRTGWRNPPPGPR